MYTYVNKNSITIDREKAASHRASVHCALDVTIFSFYDLQCREIKKCFYMDLRFKADEKYDIFEKLRFSKTLGQLNCINVGDTPLYGNKF